MRDCPLKVEMFRGEGQAMSGPRKDPNVGGFAGFFFDGITVHPNYTLYTTSRVHLGLHHGVYGLACKVAKTP